MPQGVEYQILRADKEGCPAIPDMKFTDPQEASLTAKKLSKIMGEKLMIKPITNPQWKLREMRRFDTEEYRYVPWVKDSWWHTPAAKAIHSNHFPHPSLERPGYLAYTKSEEDGTIDKQTIVRPGAYLNKYFRHVIDMYGLSERNLVQQFMLAYGPIDIKFAATEKEIISVYENGPDTCMKGRNWPGDGRNPAWVYAAGDLQVAYLGDLDDASARALVWPDKKRFSRVYGDIARLTSGLERLGYKWGAPIGAKLHRVKLREVNFDPKKGIPAGCFLVPYIDKKNQAGGGHLSVLDKGDHLEICEEGVPGSHHCGQPHGFSGQYVPRNDEYPTFTCDRCDDAGHRELVAVLSAPDDEGEEWSWCPHCARINSFQDQWSGNRFSTEDVEAVEVDGELWAKYYADMYAVRCEMTGALCHEDHTIVLYMDDGKPKRVSKYWADDCGGWFKSSFTNRYYLKDRRKIVYGSDLARYAASTELRYHAFQCDECQYYWQLSDRTQKDDELFCPTCVGRLKFNAKADQKQVADLNIRF